MVKSKKEETAEEHRNPPSPSNNNNNIPKPSLSSLFSSILLKYLWTILTKLSTRRIISILQTLFPAYSDTLFYFPTDKFDCFDVVECKDDQTNEIKEQQGLFAITIDDGLCRSSSPSSSLIPQLSTLLSTYNATATFFICSDYTLHNPTITKQAREVLLKTNNCDIGCHMKNDDCHAGSYAFMKKEEWKEEFEREWDGIEWLLCGKGDVWSESKVPNCRKENVGLEDEGGDDGSLSERTNTQSIANPKENNDGGEAEETRWFRAPQGVYTPSMRSALRSLSSSSTSTAKSTKLHRINYIHVLGDAYCDDWKLASYDPSFVANTMLQQIQPGSIAIFHMPEEGFRRECFDVLERVLKGAKERGLRGVALRELWERRKMG